MRFLLTYALGILLLAGCASIDAVTNNKPLDPVQVQRDLAVAKVLFQDGACGAALLASAAAPIIKVSVDSQGNAVLDAVASTGAKLCSVPAVGIASPPGTSIGTLPPPTGPPS